MSKSNLQSRVPKIRPASAADEAERFIAGASEEPRPSPPAGPLPWEDPAVREDVKKLFSLRLPEPLMLKLQYISSVTGRSMHQYVLEHLEPAIEEEVRRLRGRQ